MNTAQVSYGRILMKTLLVIFCLALGSLHAERVNVKITITAGTPVRISGVANTIADRIVIQMLSATTGGLGYVMLGVTAGTTPVANTWPTIQLCGGTATAPGCSYSDVGGAIDVSRIWIDGAQTGDTVTVTYNK